MTLRIALVHDYLKDYGGAERVLEALHEIYPQATVYTSVYLPQYLGPHKKRFASWNIKTSWLNFVPFRQKLISPFRLLSPFIFSSFDFSNYDVVIVSATGAYFPNSIDKKNALHVCYCHTPPRYLYGYVTARNWKKHKTFAILGAIANHILRIVDYDISKRPDYYIANSKEVKARIEKFYRRESTVIYPSVDIAPFTNSIRKSFFLTGGRLARSKHTDLIIKACLELGVTLKVFGKSFAGFEGDLKNLLGKKNTVEFLGEIPDGEKYMLMSQAKAFLFASEDEDFGIIPLEAMSQGCPVIAFKSGGVKETVVDGKTGVFFDALTIQSLKGAIKKFEGIPINPMTCRKHAEAFSEDRFKKEITLFIDQHLKKNS